MREAGDLHVSDILIAINLNRELWLFAEPDCATVIDVNKSAMLGVKSLRRSDKYVSLSDARDEVLKLRDDYFFPRDFRAKVVT